MRVRRAIASLYGSRSSSGGRNADADVELARFRVAFTSDFGIWTSFAPLWMGRLKEVGLDIALADYRRRRFNPITDLLVVFCPSAHGSASRLFFAIGRAPRYCTG